MTQLLAYNDNDKVLSHTGMRIHTLLSILQLKLSKPAVSAVAAWLEAQSPPRYSMQNKGAVWQESDKARL